MLTAQSFFARMRWLQDGSRLAFRDVWMSDFGRMTMALPKEWSTLFWGSTFRRVDLCFVLRSSANDDAPERSRNRRQLSRSCPKHGSWSGIRSPHAAGGA
jgi:hypothetical protein